LRCASAIASFFGGGFDDEIKPGRLGRNRRECTVCGKKARLEHNQQPAFQTLDSRDAFRHKIAATNSAHSA